MKATDARKQLQALASPERAASALRFFKTGPGQYGEGDRFLGVPVPVLRKIARTCRNLPLDEVESLLRSPLHEERLLALLILVFMVDKNNEQRETVYSFYLRNTTHVNNWDLVDSSAPTIVGGYLHDRSRQPLFELVQSTSLWERRIAVVATQYFIRRGDCKDTLSLSRLLLSDREDLMHKATGWMLREVGDQDETALRHFLDDHAAVMPRTMLRYALEHLNNDSRQHYLQMGRPRGAGRGQS